MSTRTNYTFKNLIVSAICLVITTLLSFVSRTIFIKGLGETYLGINGLFANILGVLSLAELGVGSAVTYALYKSLAENNQELVSQIVTFYRNAYRVVSVIILALGFGAMPFLRFLLKGAENIEHIYIIFSIFLINSVTSYLISYKTTVLSADQKNYKVVAFTTVSSAVTTAIRIAVLIATKNYLLYLTVEFFLQLVEKFALNYYTEKCYPYLKKPCETPLPKDIKQEISSKIKALIFNKFGEVAITQTDNIITSAIISVSTVGLVSNFTMIINIINKTVLTVLNSAVGSLGNFVATEINERKLQLFKKYDFLSFWLYSFCAITLYELLTPFVAFWLGERFLIDQVTVALLCANFYLAGQKIPLINMRNAVGLFEQDRWLPILNAILNIVLSVYGAYHFGLKGIYLGSIISGLVPCLFRPYIVYKHVFNVSSKEYYKVYFLRIIITLTLTVLLELGFSLFALNNQMLDIFLRLITCIVVVNLTYILCFSKTTEFCYYKDLLQSIIKKGAVILCKKCL